MKSSKLAEQLSKELQSVRAIARTPEIHLVFRDETILSFQAVDGDPRPRGTGGVESSARRFYDSVKQYTFTPKGVEFEFSDGSRWALDLSGATRSK